MEIFHAFGIDWKLMTIQGINFAVVLFVLHRYAYKPIMVLIANRQEKIAKGLEDASKAAQDRKETEAERNSLLSQAREEGGEIVDKARKEGIAKERQILHDAQEKGTGIISEARAQAQEEREHILKESQKDIARVAVLAAEKILKGV